MRNKFDRQLSQLNTELITMGALCEEAITNAVKYLTDGDEESRDTCLAADSQIDEKERDIESLCIKLILQQQPVAKDLRVVSAALKMISDMERIGDQASDIVEIAPYVAESGIRENTHIRDMADATIRMVSESVESFVKMDMDIAYQAMEHDNIVDELFDKVKSELIKSITEGDHNAEALIDLLMIAKYFERIGDHAENIAEWVVYSITGKHKNLSGYQDRRRETHDLSGGR
ncbi:MAG: phosphate signaling complex protein PhoU [Ruminococcus flavefaciens]|nr:phosphate signaling complex protein PhoU [Clostridium sp.]MCM1235429.1 phosphate signaling complex protein PhoU [Ruminococcus flavefaciens]